MVLERDPPPDAEPWRATADPRERLRLGLGAIYGWYARNAAVMACVLRDAEHHALTREVAELRFRPHMAAYQAVLGADLGPRQRGVLGLALSFFSWRTLVRDGGLAPDAAVDAMVRAVGEQPRG
jgi:hypothetical protein